MHSWLNGAVRRSSSSLGGILERLLVYVPAEIGEPDSATDLSHFVFRVGGSRPGL
jgi:hypothetical protein